jgi:hypothetical protein
MISLFSTFFALVLGVIGCVFGAFFTAGFFAVALGLVVVFLAAGFFATGLVSSTFLVRGISV